VAVVTVDAPPFLPARLVGASAAVRRRLRRGAASLGLAARRAARGPRAAAPPARSPGRAHKLATRGGRSWAACAQRRACPASRPMRRLRDVVADAQPPGLAFALHAPARARLRRAAPWAAWGRRGSRSPPHARAALPRRQSDRAHFRRRARHGAPCSAQRTRSRGARGRRLVLLDRAPRGRWSPFARRDGAFMAWAHLTRLGSPTRRAADAAALPTLPPAIIVQENLRISSSTRRRESALSGVVPGACAGCASTRSVTGTPVTTSG
jgi:hypothetical protein